MTAGTTYLDLVEAYRAAPGATTLDDLRRAVRSAPNFDADLHPGQVGGRPSDRQGHAALAAELRSLMPGALLSPWVHARLAESLRRSGQPAAADREAALCETALSSILATGDGSAEHPWSVLRVSDEHDVLRSLGRRPVGQHLDRVDGRRLDRLVCDDDSEVWFDVTALFPTA